MAYLVSGGTGGIRSYIVRSLIKDGEQVFETARILGLKRVGP